MNNDKKAVAKRLILDILLSVFIFVFVLNGYSLYLWTVDNIKTEQLLNDLNSDSSQDGGVVIINPTPSKPENDSNTSDSSDSSSGSSDSSLSDYEIIYKTLYKDFTGLKLRNPETKGWIKVAGLEQLDYPFVQGRNNTYYTLHDFDKNRSEAGWVFADYRANFENFLPNTLFHGHSRLNGTMFGSIRKCYTAEWYNNPSNHYIFITTEKDEFVFQIFSVYKTDIYSGYSDQTFNTKNAYSSFLKRITGWNIIPALSYDVSPEDPIITLSTCDGPWGTPDRMVVHAKLIYAKNDPSLESYKLVWKETSTSSLPEGWVSENWIPSPTTSSTVSSEELPSASLPESSNASSDTESSESLSTQITPEESLD